MINKTLSHIKVEKIVNKGYGLGFYDGKTIFVNNAIPGDVVTIQIMYSKKRNYFAKIIEFEKKSSQRIDKHCEAYGKCGGCNWIDVGYENQIKFKEKLLNETFQKIDEENTKILPFQASNQSYFYRNKSIMPISGSPENPQIGMFQKETHKIVSHKKCYLQPDIYDEVADVLLNHIKSSKIKIYDEKTKKGNLRHLGFRYSVKTNELVVFLITKNRKLSFTKLLVKNLTDKFPNIVGIVQNINPTSGNTLIGDDEKILFGRNFIKEEIGGVKFNLNYKSFFQINPYQVENLYNYIKDKTNLDEVIIDAYSGIGSIGMYLASKVKKIFAIESNKFSVEDGKLNAELNSLDNIFFYNDLVEKEIGRILDSEKVESIIFDPPRSGLERSIVEEVCESKINKIIYVSCNPATQARDAKLFQEKGFKILERKGFDMFPHTFHIENVMILER
jgi:23S rRNA (uracil1939-C5)-methyltransferase